MVHEMLKPGLENFEHHFARVWDECNFVVAWPFYGIAFLRESGLEEVMRVMLSPDVTSAH